MSAFLYPMPSGNVFHLNVDTDRWSEPEILNILARIKHADLLYDSLKKLVAEMAPINLITQSVNYREAEQLLSLLEPA